MKQKTSLAAGIEITKDMAEFDASCKRLLSENIILAWIMKSCLDEFKDFDVNAIAETINRYRISEEQMIGNIHENTKNYDLLSVVMVCLGEFAGVLRHSLRIVL